MTRRAVLTGVGIAALVVIVRLPTLFVPASAADEGLYADIGWSLTHGAVLYRDAWDNKPPGMYWLAALVSIDHISVIRLQLVLLAAVICGALLAFMLGRRLRSTGTGVAAALLFLALTAIPDFAGDQLDAEIIAAVPAAAALFVLLGTGELRARRAVLAGMLAGVACLFKLQFGADAIVVVSAPFVLAAAGGRPARAAIRRCVAAAAGVLLTFAAAAIALAATGALQPFIEAMFTANAGYLSHFQTGPALTTPTPATNAMFVIRLAGTLVIGGAITLRLCRRHRVTATLLAWWLTWDVAAVMLDARGLSHYALQLAIPLCVSAAVGGRDVLARLEFRWVARVSVAIASAVVVWASVLAVQYVPRLTGTVIAGGAAPPAPPLGIVSTLRYYRLGWGHVFGTVSQAVYERSFTDPNYPLNIDMAHLIDAHSTPGESVCIWQLPSPWTFALSKRLSSTRFLWMETAYDAYPGSQDVAIDDLEAHPPAVLIGASTLPAPVLAFLDARNYRRVSDWLPGIDYWLAPGQP